MGLLKQCCPPKELSLQLSPLNSCPAPSLISSPCLPATACLGVCILFCWAPGPGDPALLTLTLGGAENLLPNQTVLRISGCSLESSWKNFPVVTSEVWEFLQRLWVSSSLVLPNHLGSHSALTWLSRLPLHTSLSLKGFKQW
jgi:hypothetical protein